MSELQPFVDEALRLARLAGAELLRHRATRVTSSHAPQTNLVVQPGKHEDAILETRTRVRILHPSIQVPVCFLE